MSLLTGKIMFRAAALTFDPIAGSFSVSLLTGKIMFRAAALTFDPVAGSFSVSLLTGKIMFRDVHYITDDFSVRVILGFAIFRWWRPFTQKELTEGTGASLHIVIISSI